MAHSCTDSRARPATGACGRRRSIPSTSIRPNRLRYAHLSLRALGRVAPGPSCEPDTGIHTIHAPLGGIEAVALDVLELSGNYVSHRLKAPTTNSGGCHVKATHRGGC